MHTNLYLAEQRAAMRQHELLAEAEQSRLLAALPRERRLWMRRAAQYLWGWLYTLGARRDGSASRKAHVRSDS